jgi:hypothetical protein
MVMVMRRSALVAFLLLLFNSGWLTASGGASPQVVDHAYGSGTVQNWAHCPDTPTVTRPNMTFSFDVSSSAFGQNPSGTFSFTCSSDNGQPPQSWTYAVDCLRLTPIVENFGVGGTNDFVPGYAATMTGVITSSTDPLFPVGQEASWTAFDGGAAGMNDTVGALYSVPGCYVQPGPDGLTSGDIAVDDGDAPASVAVTPATATDAIGGIRTVTATVTSTAGGPPPPDTQVLFTITGATQTGGECLTDSTGSCVFQYIGPSTPGSDTITACADTFQNDQVDPGEPCAAPATTTWVRSVTLGPQAMDGKLKALPGTTTTVGYDFSVPGKHPAATLTFTAASVTFAYTCTGASGGGTFSVPIPDSSFSVPANSDAWYPSGNQADPSTYQASLEIPSGLCDSGVELSLAQGGTFVAGLTSTDTAHKVSVRWHYAANGVGGGWSKTASVIPQGP